MKRTTLLLILSIILVLGTVGVVLAAYPSAGIDDYQVAGELWIGWDIDEFDSIDVAGPTKVERQPPFDPNPGVTPETIETEIVEMELTGSSPLVVGPITVRVRPAPPAPPSTGQITEITPGIDFPAESFFDVTFEVELEALTLHSVDPITIKSDINDIPHYGALYTQQPPGPVPLYDESDLEVGEIEVLGPWEFIPPVPITGTNNYWKTVIGSMAMLGGLVLLAVRRQRKHRASI